jgi:hypothetical protein
VFLGVSREVREADRVFPENEFYTLYLAHNSVRHQGVFRASIAKAHTHGKHRHKNFFRKDLLNRKGAKTRSKYNGNKCFLVNLI